MMMTSLFSIFDPSTSMLTHSFPLNWLSTFLMFLVMPLLFWLTPSRFNYIWMLISNTLHSEFTLLLDKNNPGTTSIFIPLFFFILLNNFLGLFPYIFTSSSHLTFTLSLALPLWLSFMIFGWFKNTQHMLAHLVPQGTPPILMPFMVCIESISNLIRPGTLAIRLTANMIAGHLLLTLLGETGPLLSTLPASLLILAQTALLSLELAVAIIQAYVFTILSTLYASETK
uniref:ATP synthase F0 subunit 6 n=1 Tax=Tympanophyllum maximum TaxID=3039643 RepID=UPI00255207E4|nr:ATP synthase F0 subunit 6 [Tympanophyllum maximum]WFP43219.1 ATP synthase F0 subunit 6 [Tympanophyllum maximum]